MSGNLLDSAIILAAGRGERMRPLTTHTPKPLLTCGGKRLIEWHLVSLARAGFERVVINTSHLSEQFAPALGDGSRWGLKIYYSQEGSIPLETGGGIYHALPLLQREQFLVVNGDVFCDVDFSVWRSPITGMAKLLLVDNPSQHPHGDFSLCDTGLVTDDGHDKLTFAGIGSYRSALWQNWRTVIPENDGTRSASPRFPLAPLLRHAMGQGLVFGVHHRGQWHDIGTPERLAALDTQMQTPHQESS